MGSLRAALGIVEEEASPSHLATMYIHGERDGYCGLCAVDSVAGPGAASCEVVDDCKDLTTPFGANGDASAADLLECVAVACGVCRVCLGSSAARSWLLSASHIATAPNKHHHHAATGRWTTRSTSS